MKTIVHIHQHRIRANTKNGTNDPVIIARTYKGVRYGNHLEIKDKDGNVVATLKYQPQKPLSCGSRVWLETNLEIDIK